MKRAFKWVILCGGGLAVLIILVLLIVPMFVSIDRYKPMIEERAAEATGRPLRLAGDLELSLFPWAGFSLSHLHLGNPEGFEQDDFVYVKSFDVRVKLIPLITRDIQVKHFILEGVRVNLEKAHDGRTNWEGLAGQTADFKEKPPTDTPVEHPGDIFERDVPLKALAVGDFSISGAVNWTDHQAGLKREISDISLKLRDVSLDKPIGLTFSAVLEGKPVSLQGKIGPLGKDPLTAVIPLDLHLSVINLLNLGIKGLLEGVDTTKRFNVAMRVDPFSPKALLAAMGQEFPLVTADPDVLDLVSFEAHIEGNTEQVSLKKGLLKLDESNIEFSARAGDFSRPDVSFALEIDRIDLDRYLPPESGDSTEKGMDASKPMPSKKPEPVDYSPLRSVLLDGSVNVGALEAKGMKIENVAFKVGAKDGMIRVDPFTAALYQGTVQSDALVDVRGTVPKSRFSARIESIQAGPMVRDLTGNDIIEGSFRGDFQINTEGDQPEVIKRSLNGKGEFLFRDGAIVGIDIPGMVRNVTSAFSTSKPSEERPKTDFSELSAPFNIRNGLVDTPGTELSSPLLRVVATGTADLTTEMLDLRVDPKFVATLKGQDDTEDRRGIRVPVIVSGTFTEPRFRPDLRRLLDDSVKDVLREGIPDPSELKKRLIPGTDQTEAAEPKSTEDRVRGVLRGFGIGN